MKILDSDHCVAILRGRLDLEGSVLPEEELATTPITVAELVQGAEKSARPGENLARLDVLLAAMTIMPFDEIAARSFGKLKAQLERIGERINDLDLQIAAIAIVQQAPLVTHNQKHFNRFTKDTRLVLEDWLGG